MLNVSEFKWMTTSDIISNKTINIVFDVINSLLFTLLSQDNSQRCDADGDGRLDYQEFKAMIFRLKARKEEAAQLEEDRLRKLGRKKQIKKDTKKTKGKGKGKSRKQKLLILLFKILTININTPSTIMNIKNKIIGNCRHLLFNI